VYELEGPIRDGEVVLFRRPWMMTTIMFIGMSFCIPLSYLEERRDKRRLVQDESTAPLLNGGHKVGLTLIVRVSATQSSAQRMAKDSIITGTWQSLVWGTPHMQDLKCPAAVTLPLESP